MKKVLSFLIESITGSKDFKIKEEEDNDQINLVVKTNPEIIGLVIGKQGKTIKALRKILSIKATKENKIISVSIDSD